MHDQSLVSVAISAAFIPLVFGLVLFLASDEFRTWRDRRRYR